MIRYMGHGMTIRMQAWLQWVTPAFTLCRALSVSPCEPAWHDQQAFRYRATGAPRRPAYGARRAS
jgi:hypothetical protein